MGGRLSTRHWTRIQVRFVPWGKTQYGPWHEVARVTDVELAKQLRETIRKNYREDAHAQVRLVVPKLEVIE